MRTLLIADDESGIRSLVRMTLQRKQYEILEAADGEEALALARKHHPELVLLDVMMPGLSGFEVCRALKDDPTTADATVVMLSAKAQDSDRAEGIAAGADDYFTKPFSPIALLRKIDDVYGEE
jgi:two-component system, OmpR family, phosphate regulon response regulator PhoB